MSARSSVAGLARASPPLAGILSATSGRASARALSLPSKGIGPPIPTSVTTSSSTPQTSTGLGSSPPAPVTPPPTPIRQRPTTVRWRRRRLRSRNRLLLAADETDGFCDQNRRRYPRTDAARGPFPSLPQTSRLHPHARTFPRGSSSLGTAARELASAMRLYKRSRRHGAVCRFVHAPRRVRQPACYKQPKSVGPLAPGRSVCCWPDPERSSGKIPGIALSLSAVPSRLPRPSLPPQRNLGGYAQPIPSLLQRTLVYICLIKCPKTFAIQGS